MTKDISIDEYKKSEFDLKDVTHIRLKLQNSQLKEFPTVMLVDMPGLESGYEIHDKAIDNYILRSLAYIIAFPADDMILKTGVGNILKQLNIYNMPICIVITKCDKANDEFEKTLEVLMDYSQVNRHKFGNFFVKRSHLLQYSFSFSLGLMSPNEP